ncbi:hypothetical protein BC827DRAFT_1213383 [Russula dissimulans]|nr:hypothetical protein BC827DRAFT_1213383 [Russula dissimulans]
MVNPTSRSQSRVQFRLQSRGLSSPFSRVSSAAALGTSRSVTSERLHDFSSHLCPSLSPSRRLDHSLTLKTNRAPKACPSPDGSPVLSRPTSTRRHAQPSQPLRAPNFVDRSPFQSDSPTRI